MKKSDMPVNKGQDTAGKKERKQPLVVDEYKDTVFRILYRDDKGRQLELYNSVSGKNYTNADDLQVVTLKHAIYMGMKNDLSFILFHVMNIYERQTPSTPTSVIFPVTPPAAGQTGPCIHPLWPRPAVPALPDTHCSTALLSGWHWNPAHRLPHSPGH